MKENIVRIESPEKIIFDYRIAEPGARMAAYIIDSIIQIVIILVFLFGLLTRSSFFGADKNENISFIMTAFFFILLFCFQWFYFIVFELITNGQSPGKKLMKIRVVKADGKQLDFETIVLRNFLRVIDGFPGFTFAAGGLVSIIDRKARRIGDIVSDTIVAYEMEFNLTEPDFKTNLSMGVRAEKVLMINKKLSEEQLYVLRKFLNECEKIPEEKRLAVASKLAENINKMLGLKESAGEPVKFIERIYWAHTHENKK